MVARRTVVTTAAWAVPAVIVGVPAAAMTCSQATVDDVGFLPADSVLPWRGDQVAAVTGVSNQYNIVSFTMGVAPDNLELDNDTYVDAIPKPCPFVGELGVRMTTEYVAYRRTSNAKGVDVNPMTEDRLATMVYRSALLLQAYGLNSQADLSGIRANKTYNFPDGPSTRYDTAPGAIVNALQAVGENGVAITSASDTPATGTRISAGPNGYPGYQWEMTATADGINAPAIHTIIRNAQLRFPDKNDWATFQFIITIETSNGKKLVYRSPDL